MANRQTLPLLLVAVVLAALAFFWLSDSGRRSAPAASAPEKTAATPAAPEAAVVLQQPPATTPEPTSPVPARVQVAETPDAPARAERRSSGGTSGVRGSVVDPSGAPIAGARVIASTGRFPLDLEAEEELDWFERLHATTDAQGKFELTEVDPGALQLAVRAHGFAPFDRKGLGVPADGKLELEPIVMTRGAILTGVVVDPGGRGVAGARIVRRDIEEGAFGFFGTREPSATTDSEGRFRVDELACGPWRFVVSSDEHPDLLVEGVTEEAGAEAGGLRWQLAPGATISGVVEGVPEAERGKLEVRAQRAGRSGRFEDFADFVGGARTGAVASDGRFTIHGLAVGESFDLQARRANRTREDGFWERSRSPSVTARAGDSGVVLAYQPEAAVRFSVVDASTGAPIEKLRVESGTDWPMPLRGEDGRIQSLFPNGDVRAGGLRPDRADERVQVSVNATGYREYQRDDIALRPGQELDLGVVRLDPVPVVRVHVVDSEHGTPVAEADVRVEKDLGDVRSIRHTVQIGDSGGEESLEIGEGRSARTDAEGWAAVTSYEGETVQVSVRAKGYAPAVQKGLFLPRGQVVEQELRLDRGGEALVIVKDASGMPLAGTPIEHREPDAQQMMMIGGPGSDDVTDSEGHALFENLAPGLHSFRIQEGSGGGIFAAADTMVVTGLGDTEGGWTEVQVNPGERAEVVLEAAPRGLLAGRVREGGKALSGATVKLRSEQSGERPAFLLPGMKGGPEARTDGEGRYRLDDVKAGRYTLVVEHPTRRMAHEVALEVKEGDNAFDVDLTLSILEGRVRGTDGKPLAGVKVWPEKVQEEGAAPRARFVMAMIDDGGDGSVVSSGELGGDSVRTDADGRYSLRGVLPDQDLVVRAEGDSVQPGRSENVRVAPDQTKDGVDLTLQAAGSMDVRAEMADGTPARFCLVQAEFAGEADAPVEPKTGFIQNGTTTLRGLRPGAWRVSLRKMQGGPNDDAADEKEVEVVAGETATATFQLD